MAEEQYNSGNFGAREPQPAHHINDFAPHPAPMPHHAAHSANPHPHAHTAAAHKPQHNPKPAASPISGSLRPVPTVKMFSTRGMEYAMMSLALWIVAVSLAWILMNLVNDSRSFNFLVVPTSALVVSLPIYAAFFIRLKRAEINNPKLRFDPSRRRWLQLTQFLAYIVCLVNLIILVYELLLRYGTDRTNLPSLGRVVADAGVVLLISFVLLAYYWVDEHRLTQE